MCPALPSVSASTTLTIRTWAVQPMGLFPEQCVCGRVSQCLITFLLQPSCQPKIISATADILKVFAWNVLALSLGRVSFQHQLFLWLKMFWFFYFYYLLLNNISPKTNVYAVTALSDLKNWHWMYSICKDAVLNCHAKESLVLVCASVS